MPICFGPEGPLTTNDLLDCIRTRFGAPVVEVELNDEQIDLAIRQSLYAFQRYLPKADVQGQILGQGVHELPFPEGALGLLDVEFVEEVRTDGLTIEAALLSNPWTFIAAGVPNIDIKYYDLQRHWLELTGRVFDSEPSFYLTENKVYVQLPSNMKVTLTWAQPLTAPEEVPFEYQQLFKDLTYAHSQEILGNIRAKYGGVPASGGGVVQLDGDYHRQRGAEEKARILNELRTISPYYTPSYG